MNTSPCDVVKTLIKCILPNTIDAHTIDLITPALELPNLSKNSFCNQPLHKNSSANPIKIQKIITLIKFPIINLSKLNRFTIRFIKAKINIGIPNLSDFLKSSCFFVNTYDCPDIAGDLDKMFDLLKGENIKGLQIPYDNLIALDKEDFKRRLDKDGVKLLCTHIVARLLSKDENVFEKAIEGCKKALEYISYFGCEYFMVVPFTPSDVEGFEDRPRAMQSFVKALLILVEEAKKYNIKVAIENISQLILPFSKIEDLEYILEKVPGLGFCFDTGNFLCMGIDDTSEAFERLKDRIDMVHIKELVLCGKEGGLGCDSGRYVKHVDFGTGQTNLTVMLSKLYAYKKDVPYIIEVQNGRPELSWVKQASRYFDEIFAGK